MNQMRKEDSNGNFLFASRVLKRLKKWGMHVSQRSFDLELCSTEVHTQDIHCHETNLPHFMPLYSSNITYVFGNYGDTGSASELPDDMSFPLRQY